MTRLPVCSNLFRFSNIRLPHRMLRRLLLAVPIVLAFVWLGCDTPPLVDMVNAESALSNARSGHAKKYAKDELESAEVALQKAREEMAFQQGRLSVMRSYDLTDTLIAYARMLMQTAEDSAKLRREVALANAEHELKILTEDLNNWRESLDSKLTLYRAEKLWTMAQMSQATAMSLLRQEDLEGALDTGQECREQLAALRTSINHHDADELERIRAAKGWVSNTLSDSRRNGNVAIIVDKEEHRLHIFDGGKKLKTYKVDLGFNAAYQKMFAGDGATPEGTYRVTEVKHSSRYYKALLLNYPNDDDKRRFAANKRNGRISKRAGIGKLIEIHGHGGQNKNWTDGCVALADNDMLELMKYARVGTPVTIVRKLEGVQ